MRAKSQEQWRETMAWLYGGSGLEDSAGIG
jgi:hypothetical protein